MSLMIVCYLWVHHNVDSWGRLLLLFLSWWIVVWYCYYSLLVKLWLSELTSWLMIKRITGAMMILSLVPCSSSSSSNNSGCRLVIIISIINILATWQDCCSGWINIFMIDITSIVSILLDIRGNNNIIKQPQI